MKAHLRHIKWITSGTHCTPEQLRLPFHTLQKPTDIYYFNKVYARIYSYVLCISVYILLYTVIYTDIYYFKKYILVCTRMNSAYLYIYSCIVWYTDIYYFNKVYTRMYSYALCISVYIVLYTVIYGQILLQQSIYWYILVCTLYICVYTTEYLTQGLSLGLGLVNFLKSNAIVHLKMYFSSKAMLPYISRYLRKLGYFITLMRGCPGSQLSKGFKITEDILRYATVHMLIYACFLMCIWTPLESWLPGQPLEILHVCVYRLIYGSIALDISYGKENEKNAMLYWVYTGLYSVQISIYR